MKWSLPKTENRRGKPLEFDKVDLIISDVFMPTLDGVRFHDYVREFTDAQDDPFHLHVRLR